MAKMHHHSTDEQPILISMSNVSPWAYCNS
ncbi:hypothetical protein S40285_10943 [Stachybotrys chlorohalonatus IBT 40285]|uniref:Uncharacterized protein n=1 Tax=Stachybotrys chlorohalonatus (strain IBT 40285) TaxID=1283841 RepID=A0A084QV49_STAC4|nr:hypothetical protein S40285_10943 [Stachybotrys chlorohalonata IBT 40285]